MLLLSRRNHQGLVIEPDASIPANMKVTDLFGENGIRIKVVSVDNGVVKLGIDAPKEFKILRNELDNWNSTGTPTGQSKDKNKKEKTPASNMFRRRKAYSTPRA